jgi:hypothetical protein
LRMPTICVSLNRDFFTMDSFEAKASGFSTYFRSLFQATRHRVKPNRSGQASYAV